METIIVCLIIMCCVWLNVNSRKSHTVICKSDIQPSLSSVGTVWLFNSVGTANKISVVSCDSFSRHKGLL